MIPDDDDIAAWLRLTEAQGVGGLSCRKLLGAFGLPQQIFSASLHQLGQVVPEKLARALLAEPDAKLAALIDATQQWAKREGNHFLTLADTRYPARLLEIPDPPPVLYAKGRLDLLESNAIAVVGSRNASTQGNNDARNFSQTLSNAGWTIVSGMALGIDTAAHEGALLGGASTIAIIGTGADIVYPARNRPLAHRIAAEGLILSEFSLGTPAVSANFPRRNRIISGLARGVLVVEAAAQSGSLITARMAGEQGREVFAIPGSIHSPLAKGCHKLIRDGAKLVESAEDVLEELAGIQQEPLRAKAVLSAKPARASHHNGIASTDSVDSAELDPADLDPILALISFAPIFPDEIAARSQMDMATLSAHLMELELLGQIERLPGGAVQRLA